MVGELPEKKPGVSVEDKGVTPEEKAALLESLEATLENFAEKLFRDAGPVLDSLQEGIAITTPDGAIVRYNEPLESILGYTPAINPFERKELFNYSFQAAEQKQELLEEVMRSGEPKTSTRVEYNFQGETRYFNLKISPLKNEQSIFGAQVSFTDATKDVLEAIKDGLTGAYSQSYYVRELKDRVITLATRANEYYLGIIAVDLKGLNTINNDPTLGHDVGDELLKATA